MSALLEVQRLKKYFPITKGIIFQKVTGLVRAVDDVSFTIAPGETLGLVGESGCGKTTTSKMILRLDKPTEGAVIFDGKPLATLNSEDLRRYRATVQAVFQDPYGSLNARMRVGSIVAEPVEINTNLSGKAIRARVEELLDQVGLSREAVNLFPHEFSGGQRQRIAIARALAPNPSLIVLDEPVSALDVSIRAQVMNLLKDLQDQLGLAYLLIAHSLATIRYMSHRIIVMYLGKIVESGASEVLFSRPLHPYTQALLSAALPSHPDLVREEIVLQGEVPSALNPPPGCHFHPRCMAAKPVCSEVEPQMKAMNTGNMVACHLY